MNPDILLCTLGTSWAIIPEVYGFLAPDRLPLYACHPQAAEFESLRADYQLAEPDEIWVVTTGGRATHFQGGIQKLREWAEGLPAGPALRVWQAEGTDELASQAECDCFRELLLRVCLLAHGRAGTGQVVMSLAGGRKTMSADMQWAGSLLGCKALIHVVGVGELPDELRNPSSQDMSKPLPATIAATVVPLIAGAGFRSELLDVDLDGVGPVSCDRFSVPLAAPGVAMKWAPDPCVAARLCAELRRRERAGSRLLGNYLASLGQDEQHENWRSLYRLPPRLIETLRSMRLTPDLRDWLTTLPLADLHRHLGGCLSLKDQQGVAQAIWNTLSADEQSSALTRVTGLLETADWPPNWPRRLRDGGYRCDDAVALLVHASPTQLQHNLYDLTEPRVALAWSDAGFTRYEQPGELSGSALLEHPVAHAPYARAIVRQARAEGLAYLELRGSPQKYGDGLRFLRSFYAELLAAQADIPEEGRPCIRFIIIADRRDRGKVSEVVQLALLAHKELPEFIAGVDLAGDENVTGPKEVADAFIDAFEACLPLTIHAGESTPAERIWEAAYHLHADRIGHGLTLGDHPQLAARFRNRGICLELCPTSNREVVGFRDPDYPDSSGCPVYPLKTLWEAGLPLTLCTDNPGISRTTLADEYLTAARMIGGLTVWDTLAMIRLAFRHAFLSDDQRMALMRKADARMYQAVLGQFGT